MGPKIQFAIIDRSSNWSGYRKIRLILEGDIPAQKIKAEEIGEDEKVKDFYLARSGIGRSRYSKLNGKRPWIQIWTLYIECISDMLRHQVLRSEVKHLLTPTSRKNTSMPSTAKRTKKEQDASSSQCQPKFTRHESSKLDKSDSKVARIMKRNGVQYLVYWQGRNFTQCSWLSKSEVKQHRSAFNEYRDYELGCRAILESFQSNPWYTSQRRNFTFQLCTVPILNKLSDDKLRKRLNAPAQYQSFHTEYGYWKFKKVELQWLATLSLAKASLPPLYLECLSEHSKIKPPKFQMVIEYDYSDVVKSFFSQNEKSPHLCLFKKNIADRCDSCRCHVELNLNGSTEVSLPEAMTSDPYFVIVCAEDRCECPGGWAECKSWIPDYPRTKPVAVVYDPRYRGWGARAMTAIKRGHIMAEYHGKVLMKDEAEGLYGCYMFEHKSVIVDSKSLGNESRFFGHSCDPNMVTINLYGKNVCTNRAYRILFVAKKDIEAGDDLTFDYHPRGVKPSSGYSTCKCGADECRKWV